MRHQAFDAIFHELGFPPAHGAFDGAVLYSIGRTYSLVVRQLEQVYARFGLSAPSFNLLMLLKHGVNPEACTQREIGERLVVSASDMTGLIDRLEKKSLVRRAAGKDRRCKLIRITPAGTKLLDELWPHHSAVVARVTKGLTKRRAEQLVRALTTMREAASR